MEDEQIEKLLATQEDELLVGNDTVFLDHSVEAQWEAWRAALGIGDQIDCPIPSIEENPDGLHRKYIVRKADGSPNDPNASYFVLRLDDGCRDEVHLRACRIAAAQYASEITRTAHKSPNEKTLRTVADQLFKSIRAYWVPRDQD